MRPFPSEASAASLPPAPPRLLPGGTNQFPGGIFTRLRPAPSTAHNELPFIPVLTETPHPPEGSGRPLPSERLRIRAGERAAKPGVVSTANSGCHFPAPSPCDPKPSGDGARVLRAVSGIRGQVSGFRRQESETPSCSGLAFWPPALRPQARFGLRPQAGFPWGPKPPAGDVGLKVGRRGGRQEGRRGDGSPDNTSLRLSADFANNLSFPAGERKTATLRPYHIAGVDLVHALGYATGTHHRSGRTATTTESRSFAMCLSALVGVAAAGYLLPVGWAASGRSGCPPAWQMLRQRRFGVSSGPPTAGMRSGNGQNTTK